MPTTISDKTVSNIHDLVWMADQYKCATGFWCEKVLILYTHTIKVTKIAGT